MELSTMGLARGGQKVWETFDHAWRGRLYSSPHVRSLVIVVGAGSSLDRHEHRASCSSSAHLTPPRTISYQFTPGYLPSWQTMSLKPMSNLTNYQSSLCPTYVLTLLLFPFLASDEDSQQRTLCGRWRWGLLFRQHCERSRRLPARGH
jgi:hypothetical protein